MDTTIQSIATGLGEIRDTSVTQQHKPGESLYFNSIQRTQPNIVAHALTCLPNIGAWPQLSRGILSWGILSWGILSWGILSRGISSQGILSFSIFGTHKIWGILSQVNFSLGEFCHGGFCRLGILSWACYCTYLK